MTKIVINTFKIISFVVGFYLFSLLMAQQVDAQSIVLSPANGAVSTQGSTTINILVADPNASNGATVDLTVPSPLTVTGATPASGGNILTSFGCAAGSANFSANQVCFSLAATSDFSVNQNIGSFTIRGTSTGNGSISFGSSAELNDGVNSFPLTGTAGTYTITADVLPDTAINIPGIGELENYTLLIIGLILFDAAALLIFLRYRQGAVLHDK